MSQLKKAQQLIADLYAARKAAKDAKNKLDWSHSLPCKNDPPCYIKIAGEQCAACKHRQPLWEKKHGATNKAGAALRKVLAEGKRLTGN